MSKLRDNKPLMAFIGVIALIGLIVFTLYMNVVVYYTLTWPSLIGEWLEKYKEPLKNNLFLRVTLTILLSVFAWLLYKLKKGKGVTIYGFLEIVAGIYTIYYSFLSTFENDILYALAIGGGIFLITNGLESYLKSTSEK